jgi:isocitrate lyase
LDPKGAQIVAPTPLNPEARIQEEADRLAAAWEADERWQGIRRPYTPEQVIRLRGSLPVEHTLARIGAERLWRLLTTEAYVAALGAMSGGQAVQMVKAGFARSISPGGRSPPTRT